MLRKFIFVLTLVGAISISVADVSTGYLPEATIFVLIPVIAATYFLGFWQGLTVAVVAALSELIGHLSIEGAAGDFEVIASTVTHTFIYILTAALIAGLVKQLRTVRELEEQRSRDLEIAKSVHGSVFSPMPEGYGNLSIGGRIAFARELGGDYHLVAAHKGRLFLCVADISGKSMAAALFAALLGQSVNEALELESGLGSLLSRVNSRIFAALPDEMFVTMFCAFIGDGDLEYVNAGHPPPLCYSKREGGTKMLGSSHPLPIGIVPDLKIEPAVIPFEPGDILLAVTDGVTESAAFREKPFDKLKDAVADSVASGPQQIADRIFAEAVPDSLDNPPDDVIVICVRRQD